MAGPTAVTLGKFDGLHRGHQKLIHDITGKSSNGLSSVVFVLNARSEDLILTPKEQKEALEEMGVDCLIQCPFVPEISGMQPDAFIRDVLIGRLGMRYAAVGTDFRFGFRRSGDAKTLKDCAQSMGFTAAVLEKEHYGEREISSSYIREALRAGDMPLVQALMGRPFQVDGIVIHGRHLGTRMGMPTANFIPPVGKLLPPNGVYVCEAQVGERHYRGVTNVGTKPTVDGAFKGVETCLFDHEGDLYGEHIQVTLKQFLRAEKKFQSIEALKEQIGKDIAAGRAYYS